MDRGKAKGRDPIEGIGRGPILQIVHGEKSKGGSHSDAEGEPRD